MKRICKYCKEEFYEPNGRKFSNHVRWCKKNPKLDEYYRTSQNIGLENTIFEIIVSRCDDIECNNLVFRFSESHRKRFCSRKCANKVGRMVAKEKGVHKTKRFKEKLSNITKEVWKRPEYIEKQLERSEFFNSKGECEIINHFKENYSDDKWTSGGHIRYKGESLIRDLYSNKLKVCIEYDGIWHFDNFHGQLERKHLKDNLLRQWCLENGYRLIRLDEALYKENKSLWVSKLEKEVYEGDKDFICYWSDDSRTLLESWIKKDFK